MCLYVDVTKHRIVRGVPQVKIAKRDIRVYKALNIVGGALLSPIMGHPYQLKVLKTATINQPEALSLLNETCYSVHKGLHTYRKREAAFAYRGGTFHAIIPKGSQYYLGCEGDIVSNQLIVTQKVKDIRT